MPHEMMPLPGRSHDAADTVQRGDEILVAARHAFVEKGFDGASMQDLARAAGMSAGNFYRYFSCKAAIVEAMVARDLAEVEDMFQSIASSPDPVVALKAGFREALDRHCSDKDDVLWAEIAAAAARKPEVAAILNRMEDGIVHRVAHVLGLAAGLPDQGAALARFGDHARLIFVIMHGAMTSNVFRTQTRDGALTGLIVRTMDRVIDDALSEPKAS